MWIEGGVFRTTIFSSEFTLKMAEDGVRLRLEMCHYKPYPILSDCRRIKYCDQETRQFLASPESTALITAGAFLIGNSLQKVLANFFLMINRPKVPTRVFTCEAEALEWLQAYKTR